MARFSAGTPPEPSDHDPATGRTSRPDLTTEPESEEHVRVDPRSAPDYTIFLDALTALREIRAGGTAFGVLRERAGQMTTPAGRMALRRIVITALLGYGPVEDLSGGATTGDVNDWVQAGTAALVRLDSFTTTAPADRALPDEAPYSPEEPDTSPGASDEDTP